MIENFDEIKKDLSELAGVINSFKSEAVQSGTAIPRPSSCLRREPNTLRSLYSGRDRTSSLNHRSFFRRTTRFVLVPAV